LSHPWRDFLVGLTVAVGLVGVAMLLMMFGEFTGAGRDRYPVTLSTPDATGLTKASRVTLNGVDIGEVRALRSQADPRDGVEIDLLIDKDARIPRDSTVVIQQGLVGDASLAFSASRPAEGADGGFVGRGETLRATAKSTLEVISEAIDARLMSFSDAARSFQTMTDTFTELGQAAKESFSPRTVAEVDGGAPATLASTLARLDLAIVEARGWLGDDELRADFRASVARAGDLMDQASGALEEWKSAAGRLTTRADEVGEEVNASLREFATATRAIGEAMLEVQTLVAGINRGEGTAGQFARNPDLYRSLNDAAVRLEKALTEAQLLIEKFRKEGVPVQF